MSDDDKYTLEQERFACRILGGGLWSSAELAEAIGERDVIVRRRALQEAIEVVKRDFDNTLAWGESLEMALANVAALAERPSGTKENQ
jgi:hypothetical protein